VFTYIKIGILVAAMALGASGAWYVQGVRLDKQKAANALLTRQLEGYKRALKIMKDDLKTDKETQDEKDRIDALGPDDLVGEFERLRRRSGGGKPSDTDSSETDN
jgi:hypothetical protein